MQEIPLYYGHGVAFVDDGDFRALNMYAWYLNPYGYVIRREWDRAAKKYRTIFMHRQIMETPDGQVVDHINHDRRDNQRANLRNCTNSQNLANQRPQSARTSRYKGVSWSASHKGWRAQIVKNGRAINLGTYQTEEAAARVYDSAARDQFGEFALTNNQEPAS